MELNKDQQVKIEKSATEKIIQEAKAGSLETGGVLMGSGVSPGPLFIAVASGPGPNPERGKNYFSPDLEFGNSFIHHFEAEGLDYIGEWHKHSPKTPSPGDKRLVKQRMNNQGLEDFLLLIVNTSHYPDSSQNSSEVKLIPFLFKRQLEQEKLDWCLTSSKILYPKHRYEPGEGVKTIEFPNPDLKEIIVRHGKFVKDLGLDLGLYRNGNILRWKGAFKDYGLTLLYPHDYPERTIEIVVNEGKQKARVECPDPERAIFRWIEICWELDRGGLESLRKWDDYKDPPMSANCW